MCCCTVLQKTIFSFCVNFCACYESLLTLTYILFFKVPFYWCTVSCWSWLPSLLWSWRWFLVSSPAPEPSVPGLSVLFSKVKLKLKRIDLRVFADLHQSKSVIFWVHLSFRYQRSEIISRNLTGRMAVKKLASVKRMKECQL